MCASHFRAKLGVQNIAYVKQEGDKAFTRVVSSASQETSIYGEGEQRVELLRRVGRAGEQARDSWYGNSLLWGWPRPLIWSRHSVEALNLSLLSPSHARSLFAHTKNMIMRWEHPTDG